MTVETYNLTRIVSGELTAFDVCYLGARWPYHSFTESVRSLQGIYSEILTIDGYCGPLTIAELPTRKLRCDAESLIALMMFAAAGRGYRLGAEVKWPDCRLLTWGEAAAALRPVREWDCSELVEICARMLGIKILDRPVKDGTWLQYRQLATIGKDIPLAAREPGDLVFEFRDAVGSSITPGKHRPDKAHVGIVINWNGDTIEAAPSGCGPYSARLSWTHAGRIF